MMVVARTLDEIESLRIRCANRARAYETEVPLADAEMSAAVLPATLADELMLLERRWIKELETIMNGHPLGPFIRKEKGIGLKSSARWLASIGGDPIADRRSHRQLLAYCGLHVLNGTAPRHERGTQSNWNETARSRVVVIARAAVKVGVQKTGEDSGVYDPDNRIAVSVYGQAYLDERRKAAKAVHPADCRRCGRCMTCGNPLAATKADHFRQYACPNRIVEPSPKGSPLQPAHQNARAIRMVSKLIVRRFWDESLRLQTEPTLEET